MKLLLLINSKKFMYYVLNCILVPFVLIVQYAYYINNAVY